MTTLAPALPAPTSRPAVARPASAAPAPGAVTGAPRVILRLEGAALFALATLAYAHLGALGWGVYAAVFLLPDVAFLAYLVGPRAGAAAYNATHGLLGPAALALASVALAAPAAGALALVWAAHVGFDRMLGYGLKYPSAFRDTHLG